LKEEAWQRRKHKWEEEWGGGCGTATAEGVRTHERGKGQKFEQPAKEAGNGKGEYCEEWRTSGHSVTKYAQGKEKHREKRCSAFLATRGHWGTKEVRLLVAIPGSKMDTNSEGFRGGGTKREILKRECCRTRGRGETKITTTKGRV